MLVFLALLGTAYLISLAVRIALDGRRDEQRPADAIIVLGAAQANGRPMPVLRARLDHALALYRDGLAPYLVFTGGKRPGDRFTEAETGRIYARARGAPESAMFIENSGRTTWQSMQAAAEIVRAERLRTAILVSDPYHAFRLRRMARDLGLRAYVSPAADSPIRSFSHRARYILREMATYTIYRLVGM